MRKFLGLFVIVILSFYFTACRKEKTIDSLTGTQWRIVKYKLSEHSKLTNVNCREYNLTFINDSTMGFNTDVNGCSAYYKLYGQNEIIVSGSSCTEVGGDHEKVDDLLKVFSRGNLTNISHAGNHLFLSGRSALVLREIR